MARIRIHIVGSWEKGLGVDNAYRYRVEINQVPIGLPPGSFHVLCVLCIGRCGLLPPARAGRPGGWVNSAGISFPPSYATKYVHLMQKELVSQLPKLEQVQLVENDRAQNYRIDVPPELIRFHRANLMLLDSLLLRAAAEPIPVEYCINSACF